MQINVLDVVRGTGIDGEDYAGMYVIPSELLFPHSYPHSSWKIFPARETCLSNRGSSQKGSSDSEIIQSTRLERNLPDEGIKKRRLAQFQHLGVPWIAFFSWRNHFSGSHNLYFTRLQSKSLLPLT